MIAEEQVPERYRVVLDEQKEIYGKGRSVQVVNEIPDTDEIPIQNPRSWLRIPDVICIAVDMVGSTHLSASTHDKKTAGAYQLFTGTAVRLFDEFEAPYIEVQGDGVFALFNGDQPYRALAAAITFKTFVVEVFKPTIKEDCGLEVGGHYGIDMKTILVRKLGMRRAGGRSDRQNEVWAGKPVNMASKLAADAPDGELWASDRFLAKIADGRARRSCGCPSGERKSLWVEVDLSNERKFDFDKAFALRSMWCPKHGAEYCDAILALDSLEA